MSILRTSSRATRRATLVAAVAATTATAVLAGTTTSVADEAPRGPGTTQGPVNTRPTDDVLYRQGFDELAPALGPRVADPGIAAGTVGFTHVPPQGWSVENDSAMESGGVEEWRGWSFTTREFWVDAEDQRRNRFARAQGVIAVADSDEFADAGEVPGTYATTLASSPVRVKDRGTVELTFDSHYRGWAGQSATVTVEFDGDGEEVELARYDSATVRDDDDGAMLNATEKLTVAVPGDAKRAVFRWHFESGANSWYWAIDSVAVHAPLPEPAGEATSAWVVSDIQGDPDDLAHAFGDLAEARPDAAGLLMVGDIVASGSEAQWREVDDVMRGAADVLPGTVAAAIGNHESYTGEPWETLRDRFLRFAERDRVWDEYVLEGPGGSVPVLVLGQEAARPPEVPMSREQVEWLDDRLDHWTRRDKQVLVISHFPLGDTVSASWIPWYAEHHEHNDELTRILGDHPNAILLTGHTHYPFELGDWAVQRRTAGGHPDGFWAVNTGAIQVEWDARGESTTGIREIVTRDVNRGLVVDVHADRVVVEARDFGVVTPAAPTNDVNDVVRTVTIPNPLVKNQPGRG